jgi:transcription factor C subunit 7
MEKLLEVGGQRSKQTLQVRGERGLGDWFGKAWFPQPVPAEPRTLKREYFPWLDEEYESRLLPHTFGERVPELHGRVAMALDRVVADVDAEFEAMERAGEDVTLLICGHAAPIICSGRALTGVMPENPDDQDFQCFTCGLTRFVWRAKEMVLSGVDEAVPDGSNRRTRGGVAGGGWECLEDSGCSHLSQGAERGWHFYGDESFDSYELSSNMGPITYDGSVKGNTQGTIEYPERGSKI